MSETFARDEALSPLKRAYLALEEARAKVAEFERRPSEPLAIIGMGCRFPGGADSPEAFWGLLAEGRDAVREVPRERWDIDEFYDPDPDAPGKMSVRGGGFIDGPDRFDAAFFAISPREAAGIDPQQRLFLEVAWEALEDAAQAPDRLSGSPTGVFAGMCTNDYAQMQYRANDLSLFDPHYTSGIAHSITSGRLSYLLGLHGPSLTIDTACSSSLVAVHLACQSLRGGECAMALAGGVNLMLSPEMSIALSKSRMLAPDGHAKTFDARADGFVRGEGCGVVVLKRLADAQRDGDRVIAVIRGSAVNQDGPSSSLTAPNGPAQEAVIRQALANAGVCPGDIEFIETHGTGTQLGDPIEVNALGAVFGPGRDEGRALALGAVKTSLGHLEAAAGIAGLIKAALVVRHGFIPPNLHFQKPNPHIRWEALRFEVPTKGREWTSTVRNAGVSSIGFSGTNAHVVLSSAPALPQSEADHAEPPAHLLAISARSDAALRELARRHVKALEGNDSFADYCFTANAGRAHFAERLALAAKDAAEARVVLKAWIEDEEDSVLIRGSAGEEPPKVGFLFTGQGAQYAGMGKALYDTQAEFRACLERCDAILRPHMPRPLLEVLFDPAHAQELNETRYAQPALFALEFALSRLWRSWGIEPAVALGHSLGELAAACVAGVFSLEDGLHLVAERARLMQSMAPGGMAAVFASEDEVREALRHGGIELDFAAFNAPSETVVSGTKTAVEAAVRLFGERNTRIQPLAVSHAFHSVMMEPMLDEFERAAADIAYSTPAFRIVSNTTADFAQGDDLVTGGYWRRHVRRPVAFARSIRRAMEFGCTAFVEIGPRPTLINLAQRGLEDAGAALWLPSMRADQSAWTVMLQSLGRLYAAGADVDWASLDRGRSRRKLALPTYPFERRRYWLEALERKPRAARLAGGASAHPALGRPLPSPLAQVQYELNLDGGAMEFLREHRVGERAIVPAAAMLEMALAAGEERLGAGNAQIADFEVLAPLVLNEDGATQAQLVLHPAEDGAFRCELSSTQGSAEVWTLHARCVIGRLAGDEADLAPATSAGGGQRVDGEAVYANLAGRGLDFGPAFRRLESVIVDEACALGSIGAQEGPHRFCIHPAVLDACIQPVGAALDGAEDDALFLPIGVERFALPRRARGALKSRVQLRPRRHADLIEADIAVFDADGQCVARLDGFRLKRAQASLIGANAQRAGWFYEVRWEEQAPGAEALSFDVERLAAHLAATSAELAGRHDLAAYAPGLERLHMLCAAYARECMAHVDEAAVLPEYKRLSKRLRALADKAGDLPGASELLDALERNHPAVRHELALVKRCGPRLAEVLAGKADPLELLFPGGSNDLATALYEQARTACVLNGLAGEAARAMRPAGAIRVLEIGGGSGATTAAMVEALPDNVEYVFTDISPMFVERARAKFSTMAGFRAEVWDVEKGPQALEDDRPFDLIVAANVLHATADLRRTLETVHSVLAPDGVLLLVEVTRDQPWIDVTFGLTEGWWRFADAPLRTSSPLLDRQAWRGLLHECGFGDAVIAPESDEGAHSLIAVRKDAVSATGGRWLWIGDEDAAPNSAFEAFGAHLECALSNELVDDSDYDGIILAPNAPVDATAPVEELDAAARREIGGALDLLKRLGTAESKASVVLLTRGAQAVCGRSEDSIGAALWGLTQSGALEHPELNIRCIDCGAWDEDARAIAREILQPSREDRVALRGGRRFVQRLARAEALSSSPEAEPVHLTISKRGDLEELRYEAASRREPSAGQVLIRVHYSGLNFRDVLNALGMYAGGEVPFGGECAGEVVATGEGVEGISVGDFVAAIAEDCLASHVVAPAALCWKIPHNISGEQAAAIPIAFLTAGYALKEVAHLRRGERVLIHAAAGGVGMAAVQWARRIGAEVFVTAGSEAKRSMLRAMGIAHIYHSRGAQFADEILRDTNGRGADVVLNSLTGEMITAGMRALAPGGRFIELGRAEVLSPADVKRMREDVSYEAIDLTGAMRDRPETMRPLWGEVWQSIENGEFAPLPVRAFERAQTTEAFRFMAQARHTGKIAIRWEAASWLPPAAISPAKTCLITGAFGGLGLLTAEWLAARGVKHLALLGRSAPSARASALLAKIQARGISIQTFACDVSDEAQVRGALSVIEREMPPVGGVIHAAGVLDDALVMNLDWPRMETVLAPKARGAHLLLRLLADRPPDFFVIYSSIASILGARGQANHACACAFIDSLAHRGGIPPIRTINWGAWAGSGAAVRREVAQGLYRMDEREALAALGEALEGPRAQSVIGAIDWPSFIPAQYTHAPPFLAAIAAERPKTEARKAARPATRIDWRAQLAALPPPRQLPGLAGLIEAEVVRILGLDGASRIDPLRPLQELGLDSLMAVELRNVLAKAIGSPLPATLLFDYPSLKAVAGFLAQKMEISAAEEEAPHWDESRPADPLSQLENLSDEEIDRLFSSSLGKDG